MRHESDLVLRTGREALPDAEARFIEWEQASRDTIDVKRVYVDIAGDLVAGILLSQIVYWHLPAEGRSKLRVEHKGRLWLAKDREAWWKECRISPKQFDRAIRVLRDKELVETAVFKFSGTPMIHIGLNLHVLMVLIESILTDRENGCSPNSKIQMDETAKSLTESTEQNTNKDRLNSATSPDSSNPLVCKNPNRSISMRLFDYWNGQKIIVHQKMTTNINRATTSALKDYSEEQISGAIRNYAQIIHDPDYYFKYRWTLRDFLQRGLEKFMDLDIARQNYHRDETRDTAHVSPKSIGGREMDVIG